MGFRILHNSRISKSHAAASAEIQVRIENLSPSLRWWWWWCSLKIWFIISTTQRRSSQTLSNPSIQTPTLLICSACSMVLHRQVFVIDYEIQSCWLWIMRQERFKRSGRCGPRCRCNNPKKQTKKRSNTNGRNFGEGQMSVIDTLNIFFTPLPS